MEPVEKRPEPDHFCVRLHAARRQREVPKGKKAESHKYHQPFINLSVDEEGRIFVGTHEKSERGNAYYFDVFDSEGRYLAKVPLKIEPFKPHRWRRNKLYSVEEDEKGFQVVKRYKMVWEN